MVGAMLLTLPWLRYVIGGKIQRPGPLIMLCGYFAINSVRTIGTSWLDERRRCLTFFLGTVTLILVVLITYQAIP